jgi:wyosine [tRNA(Phe)-imidazoG37] synthetase (radical SAM superfamily)
MKSIFGPVRSRRFGTSLGIDLSPAFKQCNFDCLYCELAPSATVGRQSETVPVETIVEDLEVALREHANIDVITVTANGEPTLYPHLGELLERIDAIKGKTQTLILTNSATLTDQETFETLLRFDQVKLSLDAVTLEVFKKIDRPYEGIAIDKLVDAVVAFSKAYKGKLFIEVLFVRGLNDTPEEIAAINDALLRIDCDRIDIGTIDRPPAYPVEGISYGELHRIATLFDASLPIHIASRQHAESCASSYSEEEIVNTLDKRPLTYEDIELLFDEPSKARLQKLVEDHIITKLERSGLTFLIPAANIKRKRKKS